MSAKWRDVKEMGGREKDKEQIKVKERQTGLLQRGRSKCARVKNGLYSAVLQSGPRPLRRNSDKDEMMSAESSEAAARRLTQISHS